MVVVKLGGSLAGSAELPRWLGMIAAAGGRIVLVPGGGPWADDVRLAQAREGFDARTAHRLALRAMEQYGRTLAAMNAVLVPAENEGAIRDVLAAGKVAVWMPYAMVAGEAAIPESWDVTSDSLAAWLAGVLDASRLVLVKSLPPVGSQPSSREMARLGWVDPAFPRFVRGTFDVKVVGKTELRLAERLLDAA